jgi:hypothetical protein
MSVNIIYKEPTNLLKWKALQNGDFVIIEGNSFHPVPKGLYRIFILNPPEESFDSNISFALLPLFDGPFSENLYPYMITDEENLPTIINKVSQIHIDVNLS